MKVLLAMFSNFREECDCKSNLFAFWNEYIIMVMLLLQFTKAEQTGDWSLHLTATFEVIPYFFAVDRRNDARWLNFSLPCGQDCA